ncbi:CocE/NonD family hydrolase [Nonomuraea sp. WAC 01424]|uniref:CocE/NonD family hydrolase n=1 Tax=Nonomuraea sp. WAC 01424 TaxID=2203200 RepID=UPI00163C5F5B|nr:CocE/NonD family hydrolase [Nonomuraea sp. WAC 01424]
MIRKRLAGFGMAVLGLGFVLPAAPASAAPALLVRDGRTEPAFSYEEAVRETVYVETPMDSDHDGRRDRVAVAVMRPAETRNGMRVATIMKATPYTGRVTPSTVPDPGVFSDWYDEYFVPRGYAAVEVEVQGTGASEGCPTTGGREDVRSATAAIDWLNGRARATHADGSAAVADWSTGAVGMIGLSYDGTLAEAAAAQGVKGLRTIVPEGAISSWYDYARDQGIAYAGSLGNRYPEYQANRVISENALAKCGDVLAKLGDRAADDSAEYTPFWAERNYRRHVSRVRASVLLAQGLNDTKVRGRQFAEWWQGLEDADVPRKLWLHNGGHEDPLVTGAGAWQETLHRWMDYWLYDLDNGIMREPRVTVQQADNSWQTSANWPHPDSRPVRMWFGPADSSAVGTLGDTPATGATQTFTDDPARNEAEMIANPSVGVPYRLAYLTPPLTRPTRLSGTPEVSVRMTSTSTSTPLTALLVDYGPAAPGTSAPQPESADLFAPAPRGKPTKTPIVTRGSVDVKNRDSVTRPSPVRPGQAYTVSWRLHATDYVFPAGHRIAVVIVGNDKDYVTVDPAAKSVTVDLGLSNVVLPLAN